MKITLLTPRIAALAAVVIALSSVTSREEKNVIVFYIDDLRPELGCYGADYIQSPNIDALGAAGVVFDRAYCQQALCAPSRINPLFPALRSSPTAVSGLPPKANS